MAHSNLKNNLKELTDQKTVLAPFVLNGMQARTLEKHGYEAAYITGFGIASTFGLPDVGLITQTEMIQKIREITTNTALPFIADADTGYGNHLNVYRTVREYEKAGVSALHLEDQLWPKRCGYMKNKQVIEKEEAVSKIKAAVDARNEDNMLIIGRTDSLAIYGWEDAEDRACSFMEAGADMVFVDGISSLDDAREYYRRLAKFPLLLNDVPLFPISEIEKIGKFSIILHPGPMSWSWNAFDQEAANLKNKGIVSASNPIQTFNRAIEILDAEAYFKLDTQYETS